MARVASTHKTQVGGVQLPTYVFALLILMFIILAAIAFSLVYFYMHEDEYLQQSTEKRKRERRRVKGSSPTGVSVHSQPVADQLYHRKAASPSSPAARIDDLGYTVGTQHGSPHSSRHLRKVLSRHYSSASTNSNNSHNHAD